MFTNITAENEKLISINKILPKMMLMSFFIYIFERSNDVI
jgi:hypothetical protein